MHYSPWQTLLLGAPELPRPSFLLGAFVSHCSVGIWRSPTGIFSGSVLLPSNLSSRLRIHPMSILLRTRTQPASMIRLLSSFSDLQHWYQRRDSLGEEMISLLLKFTIWCVIFKKFINRGCWMYFGVTTHSLLWLNSSVFLS